MIKQLLAGCALIIVIGVVGFLYRNSFEQSKNVAVKPIVTGAACTQDAKICPDGSAVGRTGPSCSFAVCPPPNVELSQASTTIDFVLPSGYKRNIITSDDPTYLASYIQSNNVIDIYNYPFSGVSDAGKSPSAIMLSHTYFSDGTQATTTNSFSTITEGTNTFYEILIGKGDGHVESSYFLYAPSSVLRFDITEQTSQLTTNPNSLPQHQALQQMLATLQVTQ